MAFLGVKDTEGKNQSKPKNQNVGQYCKGNSLTECSQYFGEALLKRVCATCPT